MSRSITIDGVARSTVWEARDFEFVEHAFRGEVGQGGFDLDDPTASYSVVGLKQVLVSESTASPTRIFTGYTIDRGLGRDDEARAAVERKWDVGIADANPRFEDRIIDGGARAAETDVARVSWLLTTAFLPVRSTYVAASPTTTLLANDYTGQTPRDVLADCAEQAGKNFYLVFDGTDLALFYDLDSSSNWSSTLRLSDVDADVNSTVTWAPQWRGAPGLRRDPSELYSGFWVEYSGGRIFVQSGSVASNFRQREMLVNAGHLTTAAAATTYGNQLITDQGAAEEDVITATVTVAKQYVNLARAGQRISTKFVHLGDSGFGWRRIARRSVRPTVDGDPDQYDVTFALNKPLKTRRRVKQGAVPGSDGSLPPACVENVSSAALGTAVAFVVARERTSGGQPCSYTNDAVCSKLTVNISYPTTPCTAASIAGAWTASYSGGLYWPVTLAADANYIDLIIESFGPTGTRGTVGGWSLFWKTGAVPAAGATGTLLYGGLGVGASTTFTVPRNVVAWSATNYLVAVPDWRVNGDQFLCALATGDPPDTYGLGGSGGYHGWGGGGPVYWRRLCAGAKGWIVAAPLEATDGSETVFTLLGWDGVTLPEGWLNGLPLEAVTYDYAAETATLAVAPEAGSILLFRYRAEG